MSRSISALVNRRGVALVLALAVLFLVAVLAIAFIRVMSVEREAARAGKDATRVRMVADSGIEHAIASLRDGFLGRPCNLNSDPWVFRGNDGSGVGASVDLEDAMFPSFPYDRDADGIVNENGVNGARGDDLVHGRAVSGVLGPANDVHASAASGHDDWKQTSLDREGQVFILRVRDSGSMININGPQSTLATTLNNLGLALAALGEGDPVRGRGEAIVAARDALSDGRCTHLEQLYTVLDAEDLRCLRPYVTCWSWQDETTVKPSPNVDPRVLPTTALERRYPVNINTAPKAVLMALIRGLSGYAFRFVEGAQVGPGNDATVIDQKTETFVTPGSGTSSLLQAAAIADAIIAERGRAPFTTWSGFNDFVASMSAGSLSDDQKSVLRANFNPNTLTGRFIPQRPRYNNVSKWDLTYHTTEFCFTALGTYTITSLGLLTTRQGAVLARAQVTAVVRLGDLLRHTTQSDFEGARISSSLTQSYPESLADSTPPSSYDGQLEMFERPQLKREYNKERYCIRITSTRGRPGTNHIVQDLPPAVRTQAVFDSVTNNRGWRVNGQANSDPVTGVQGFKFVPGTLGGGNRPPERLDYCFTVPKGHIGTLRVATRARSRSRVTSFDIATGDFGPKTDSGGFRIEITSAVWINDDGDSVPIGGTASFRARYLTQFDAERGTHPDWRGNNGVRTKLEDRSVYRGSSLMPDGMLSSRSLAQELGYLGNGNLPTERGTVEFWIKLKGDGHTGSNESIFYALNPVDNPSQQAWEGIQTKIVRWGPKIYCSRAYVGHPGGARSPYPLSYVETQAEIGHFNDHEWHHVAIVWWDHLRLRVYVDGVLQTAGLTVSRDQSIWRLASNVPGDEFTVGGYQFYSPTSADIAYRGTVIRKGENFRFSNSLISDLRVYQSDQVFASQGFAPPEHFTGNVSTAAIWHGRFAINRQTATRARALSWTEYLPRKYGTTTLSSERSDIGVRYRINGGAWVRVPTPAADGGDGSGVDLGGVVIPAVGGSNPAVDVEYELTFECNHYPLNVTPVLDSIQLLLETPTQVISYRVD